MISNDVILISLGCLHCQKKVDLIHHLWSHFFWQWSQWWESAKVMSKVEKEGRAWAQKFKSSKNAVIEMRHTHSLRRRCPTQPHKTVIPCLHPISKHDQKKRPKFTSNFGYIFKISENRSALLEKILRCKWLKFAIHCKTSEMLQKVEWNWQLVSFGMTWNAVNDVITCLQKTFERNIWMG